MPSEVKKKKKGHARGKRIKSKQLYLCSPTFCFRNTDGKQWESNICKRKEQLIISVYL